MFRTTLFIKLSLLTCLILLSANTLIAQLANIDSVNRQIEIARYLDSIDASIIYQHGKVDIKDIASLNIPSGYKYVPTSSARMIVEDIWGNPADETVMGLIVKDDFTVSNLNNWAFVVSYDESGYVKDEDADDINYDDLLKEMQSDETTTNEERVKQGYPSIHLLGWASKPFYDKKRNTLHWAKKLQFGDESMADDDLALNYDVRILGRKGILSMNAVGTMNQLNEINKHIPHVLSIAEFKKGYAYADFNPSVDKVAAYTIGGLIAGKLLAKAGIFILLLKNIKLILFGLVALIGTFRKRIANLFTRKKGKNEPITGNQPMVADTAETIESDTKVDDDIRDINGQK